MTSHYFLFFYGFDLVEETSDGNDSESKPDGDGDGVVTGLVSNKYFI
tara:strand:+ start:793 stop:933 length:141 start_codon:yes stop_codon:yes gene_type:complete